MKLPILWLKDYVDVPENLTVLTNKLTSIGYMQDHRPETVAGTTVLDLEVRQNRSDCLSLIGLARETAAVFGVEYREPKVIAELPALSSGVIIENKAPEQCYRFNSISFSGITVKESPQWLKDRLIAYGIKTINNIVDITNFVMVEYGEPLHVFNLSSIAGKKLVMRLARKGEQLTVLGGKKINLTNDDLVITDADKIRGLAGVIGGAEEAVDKNTTSILLEAATYNQAYIRRTSLRHSLRTEASLRHEKFLNPQVSDIALRRAYGLIMELCGGKMIDHTESYDKPFAEKNVTLSLSAIEALGGITVTDKKVESILKSLGMQVTKTAPSIFQVVIPYYRTDIDQEADLVEEVLRIYGYDKIPEHMPATAVPKDIQSKMFLLSEKVRDILVSAGLTEVITEPLTRENNPQLEPVVLENSLNSEKTMLRTSLQEMLVHAAETQRKYRNTNIALFEVGKIYYREQGEYVEEDVVAGILSRDGLQFRNARGVAELLFERLERTYQENFVVYVEIDGNTPTYYFQISLSKLLSLPVSRMVSVLTNPPQIVREDLSLVVPADTAVGEVVTEVKNTSPLVSKVTLGEDPRILDNKTKSVFLNITYSQAEGALEASHVLPIRNSIIEHLEKKFRAKLR
ncbi:MAG: phenylalanine--tRNA ligase subunit beta [Patescibacteria group bacterium]|jgi:phenylalanyl-tRNA synthetase beta subunit